MLKFKHILKETELNDIDTVKNYLEYSFKRRKTKKSLNLYTNLNLIYSTYPDLIISILDNIPTLGYYKDYFYMLYVTTNVELESYIYNIIVTQIKLDLVNENITTMGKWLPREKSKLNPKNKFIDKFNSLFFPHIKNKITARQSYRKLKMQLNIKLGTLESKLCTRQFDSIEYDKVAPYALKMSMPTILNHADSKKGLSDYKIMMLEKMNVFEFVKELVTGKCTIDVDIVERIWNNSTYLDTIPNLNLVIENSICIVDLSNNIYNIKGEFLAVAIILLVDKYSQLSDKIIIGNNEIKLSGNIFMKIKQILNYTGPCKLINYNYDANIIYVTPNEIMDIGQNNILHIKPNSTTYDVIYYDSDDKYIVHDNVHITKKNNSDKIHISDITNAYHNSISVADILTIINNFIWIMLFYYCTM